MILFHGTIEENLKSIKKQGILDATQDQWITEVTRRKVCCVGSQPTAGEGGNPAYFAYGNPKIKSQNGYLVVVDVPSEFLQEKVFAIYDNKVLDDYVRYHFFPREEFADIGYSLWLKFKEYRDTKDRYLESVDGCLKTRAVKDEDAIVKSPRDQRTYYTEVFDEQERKIYSLWDIEFSDEVHGFIQQIGKWHLFYEFLRHHFEGIPPDRYSQFRQDSRYRPLPEYWLEFYRLFPVEPSEAKYEYLQDWFSPEWLSSRKLDKVGKNCQILSHRIPAEYIKGFIHITTPSGFAKRFKSFRGNSSFLSEVWKEALKIARE